MAYTDGVQHGGMAVGVIGSLHAAVSSSPCNSVLPLPAAQAPSFFSRPPRHRPSSPGRPGTIIPLPAVQAPSSPGRPFMCTPMVIEPAASHTPLPV
eukprot:359963-Chlamydomonas_euryale.AAC.2